MDIHTKKVFDIECKDPTATTQVLTVVGRFHFYSAAFEKANSILIKALEQEPGWLVIDEAGKLELEKKGLYRGIIQAIDHYNSTASGNLLIIVRESLCAEVISFFKLRDAQVIHKLQELM